MFRVSQITLDGHKALAEKPTDWPGDLSLGGYVRCRRCRSSWPWECTAEAYSALMALMTKRLAGVEEPRFAFGRATLFDGSPCYSLAYAEDHLLDILAGEPENGFVWSRLGNIYCRAEMYAKATRAFSRAVQVNPRDLESHMSLGEVHFRLGHTHKAAEHLHQVCRLAPGCRDVPEDTLRSFVSAALSMLLQINQASEGKIPIFPKQAPATAPPGQPVVLIGYDFNLGCEADWERLVDMVMGKPVGPKLGPVAPRRPRPVKKHKKRRQ